ncbi:MAG: YqeG family HAD IIIA-type phosphatase [Limnochordia bacterium]
MLKLLCPREAHRHLVDIDLGALQDKGIEGLILDLDNTLVAWDKREIAPEIRHWVEKAKAMGFKLCIASNSLAKRVVLLADSLGLPYVAPAIKPRRTPFRKALEILGTDVANTAVIGDQMFTDVFGGNRLGLYTILTRPISLQELPNTRLIRLVERRLLTYLEKHGYLNCSGVK